MNISKHAKMRSQQRGFSEEDIWLLLTLGEPTEKPGNVMEYKIGKRNKENLVSKFKKVVIVQAASTSDDGTGKRGGASWPIR